MLGLRLTAQGAELVSWYHALKNYVRRWCYGTRKIRRGGEGAVIRAGFNLKLLLSVLNERPAFNGARSRVGNLV